MIDACWEQALACLPPETAREIRRDEPMSRHTTLRVGGPADLFYSARDADALAGIAGTAQRLRLPLLLLGDGSNVCVSDRGIRGMVVQNRCRVAAIGTRTVVDTGHGFMRLCVRAMQASLSGLEWAVGIPGTLGGALVSNAGAYGGNICDIIERIEVVEHGERKWVPPEWMQFSYRDSRMRREGAECVAVLVRAVLRLDRAEKREIRLKTREIQLQRILKQPWEPSAGSFFKNIRDRVLAESLPTLPERMRRLGLVPTAHLAEECGLKGFQIGGAAVAARHANFIVNRGGATAADVRAVAEEVKHRVMERFGLTLEEEVLYAGEWPNAHKG